VPPIGREWARRPVVRSYLACISFMDESLGKVLDALDASPHARDTIVCLLADNGFHMGEKEHFAKYALWELTTHCLFMMRVPRVTTAGAQCQRTVDFMSIYPTLIDLCGLPALDHLDAPSLRPLLENPDAQWNRPALTTYRFGNHAVRDERWRYIRYIDGTEELYDHNDDPNEWTNLACQTRYRDVKELLGAWMPAQCVAAVGKPDNSNEGAH